MTITLLGAPIRSAVYQAVQADITRRILAGVNRPRYALVTVRHGNGDGAATDAYAKMQRQAAKTVGIEFIHRDLPFGSQPHIIRSTVDQLVTQQVDAIMLGRPLPTYLRSASSNLANAIPSHLDVEGLSSHQVEQRKQNQFCMVPCTVAAVLKIMREYKVAAQHKKVVIIGSSPVTGGPLAEIIGKGHNPKELILCDLNMPEDERLAAYASADVLIAACGVPWLITSDMVKEGVTVIDVGINDVHGRAGFNGHSIVGDVHPDVMEKAAAMTPVPGGVGPVTLAMLVQAIYRLWEQHLKTKAAT